MNHNIHPIVRAFLLWGSGQGLLLDMQAPRATGGLLSAMSVVSASSFLPSGSLADPMLLTLPSLPPPLALD
jgi:hypothetical protein